MTAKLVAWLEGRAAAFRKDAEYAARDADSCTEDTHRYHDHLRRAEAFRIAADELLTLADEIRGDSDL